MKFSTWLNALTGKDTPAGDADYIVIYDASAGDSKKVLLDNLPSGTGTSGIDDSGWVAAEETWEYASADAPTFTFITAGDKTDKYSAGMRIRLVQTTTKYFIITKVAYSDPNTTVTVYGGTDYTLADATIESPYYSVTKAPYGFPLDPNKWTVQTSDSASRTQATPVQNTWYNIGTINISIPIGVWSVHYICNFNVNNSTAAVVTTGQITLSTANNSESDADLTGGVVGVNVINPAFRTKHLVLASKTVYYLNARTTGEGVDAIGFRGDRGNTIVRAVSAYL